MKYKEFIASIRQQIAEAIRERYGNKKAEKYLQECAEYDTPKKEKPQLIAHLYDSDGNLVASGSGYAMAKFIGVPSAIHPNAIRREKVYHGYLVSYRELTQEQAKELYHKEQSAQGVTVYLYESDGTLVQVFSSLVAASEYIVGKRTNVKKEFIGKVYHGYLLGDRMMTQEEAREAYSDAEIVPPRGKFSRGKR